MPPAGKTLEARGDVHLVGVNLPDLDHHVAEVHLNAKMHSVSMCQAQTLSLERGLDFACALDCIYDTGKFAQDAISG